MTQPQPPALITRMKMKWQLEILDEVAAQMGQSAGKAQVQQVADGLRKRLDEIGTPREQPPRERP